jgi:hypothetical protein
MTIRTYRAGSSVEDYCRACKTDRIHTVIVADAAGQPIRTQCGYCRSEHNYRGGPRIEVDGAPSASSSAPVGPSAPGGAAPRPTRAAATRDPFPLVSDRERSAEPIMVNSTTDLELLLRRVIREETGLTSAAPAEKWRGGTLILKPGTPGLQEKSWPIETFFHKVVMLRNRLRTLEQQVNASDLPEDVKVKLQGYVSGCYGSLTSFNVLFAEEEDQFKGAAAD